MLGVLLCEASTLMHFYDWCICGYWFWLVSMLSFLALWSSSFLKVITDFVRTQEKQPINTSHFSGHELVHLHSLRGQ